MSSVQKILSSNGQPMLSARKTAARLQCAPDYVSKLCREGKLLGRQVEGQWFVDASSIAEFEKNRQFAKQQRAEGLAQQRRSENFEYKKQNAGFVGRVFLRTRTLRIGASIGAVAGSMLLLGALVFASALPAHDLERSSLAAAVSQQESPFFGTTPPTTAVPPLSGVSFAGATNFLSNVFATLFGSHTQPQVAQNSQPSPQQPSEPAQQPLGETSVSRAGSAPASSTSAKALPTTVVNNTYPVIEHTVTQQVAVGGVTEAELTTRLQELSNSIASQISFLQNPGNASPLQNFVVPEVINNLTNVRLNGDTVADNIRTQYLHDDGALDISGATNLSDTTINGNATTTGVAYFNTDVNIGGNTTVAGNLTVENNNGTPGTAFAGTTTVTNLAVQNTSTSTFAGGLAVNGAATFASLLNAQGLSTFWSGLISQASSTVGDSTQAGGLTVNGGATTTGNAYFANSLGIGTTTPASALSVQGNSYISGNSFFGGAITATSTLNVSGLSTFQTGLVSQASSTIGNGTLGGGLTINGGATTTGNAYFAGNVGIGVANPGYKLMVIGAISGNGGLSDSIWRGATTGADFVGDNAAWALRTSNTGQSFNIDTYNGGAGFNALTILQGGNVGIGTSTPSTNFAVQGNGYVTSGFGVGIATTAPGVLQTSGNAYVGGNLTVIGNSTTLGNSSSNTLTINSSINSSLVPNQNITYDIGSPSYFWNNGYINTLTANNIVANNTQIGGTQLSTFTINSGNNTADTQDSSLIFFRGSVVPNALLTWNSTKKRFEFNQALYTQNLSGSTTEPTFSLQGVAGQTGNIFQIASSSGSTLFSIDSQGAVSIGTTSILALNSGTTTLTNLSVTNLSNSNFAGGLNVSGLSTFTNGLLSFASSTIGNGTQNGGLTINGGATTTGNSYVAGNLSIGTTTSAYALNIGNGTTIDSMIMAVASQSNQQTLTTSGVGTRMFWYPAKGAFRAGAVVSNSTSWDDSNIGQDSFAAGQDCEANGQWSMCLGVNNIASGISAIAIGTSATASNNGAVALGGGGTQASGVNSFAASGGFALADDSFALGGGNIGQARVDSGATGGIAIGNAEVSGAFSNAFGTVVPSGTNPTVSGLNSTGFFLGDQSGSVLSGNGSAAFLLGGQAGTPVTAAQNNSFVVLGGNAGFGTTSPSQALSVQGNGLFSGNISAAAITATSTLNVAGLSTLGGFISTASSTVGDGTNGLTVLGNATTTGNLALSGLGTLITGDFSNSTIANRVALETSVVNGNTNFTFLPNGTSATAAINAYNNSNPTNAAYANFGINSTAVQISSSIRGTGTYLPITFSTASFERMRIDTTGNVGIGTTTPSTNLSVQGNQYTSGTAFFGGAITATSTFTVQGNTTLANATSTNFFSTVASSTNLFAQTAQIGNLSILGGTTNTGLSTFNAGLLSLASSTIGNGSQNGGLTINGGATTTGNAYFAGNVGIGTTSPASKLAVSGGATIGADYNVAAPTNGLLVEGPVGIGTTTVSAIWGGSGLLALQGANGNSGNMFGLSRAGVGDAGIGLGNGSFHFQTDTSFYQFDTGTSFTSQQTALAIRGNAVLVGTSSDSTLSGGHLGIWGTDGFNNYFTVTNVNTQNKGDIFAINSAGNVGIGNTSPSYNLDVAGLGHFTGLVDASNFVATSTTATSTFAGGLTVGGTNFNITPNGNVAIGGATDGTEPFEITNSGGNFSTYTRSGVGSMTFALTGGLGAITGAYHDTGDFQFQPNTSGQGQIFYSRTSGTGTLTPALYINNSSDVLLGTTTTQGNGHLVVNAPSYNYEPTILAVSSTTAAGVTSNLFNVLANGSVGVGTTSPFAKLSVTGAGTGTGANFQTTDANNNPLLTVLDNGNIGIGTNAPTTAVDIRGNNSELRVANASLGTVFFDVNNGNGNVGVGIGAAGTGASNVNTIRFGLSNFGGEFARFIPGGNFGLGTTSPSSTLSIQGNQYTSGTAFFGGAITATSTLNVSGLTTLGFASTTQISSTGNAYFATSGGSVGIGTTSPASPFVVTGGSTITSSSNTNLASAVIGQTGGSSVSIGSYTGGYATIQGGSFNAGANAQLLLNPQGGSVGLGTFGGGSPAAGLAVATNESIGYYTTSAPSNGLIVSGNVGIGTSSPTNSLSVSAGAGNNVYVGIDATVNAGLKILNSSVEKWRIDNITSDNHLRFLAGGSVEALDITQSGNVGIGTTSPSSTFGVVGSGYFTNGIGVGVVNPNVGSVKINGNTNNGQLQLTNSANTTNTAGIGVSGANGQLITGETLGDLSMFSAGGNINFSTNPGVGVQLMIKSGGNVGIGSTTPFAKLSVTGAGTGTGINFETTNSSNSPLFSVLDNGNVGIGTTSPTAKLHIEGNSFPSIAGADAALELQSDGGSINANRFAFLLRNIQQNDFTIYDVADSAARLYINNVGNIGIGTTSPSQALSVQGNGLFSGNISAAAITATSTLNVAGLSTFTNGLLSLASSTVGNGNQNGGLTVSGGATTTGNAYFPSGSVGIGIQPIANALNLGTGVNVRLTLNSHLYAASRYTDSQGGNIIYDNGTGTNFVLAETASNVFTFGGGVENSAPSLSVLSLNTSTGNVGVGTTSPWGNLSVVNSGSGPGFVVSNSANTLAQFIVSSAGNVGIGTSTPGAGLSVIGKGLEYSTSTNPNTSTMALFVNPAGTGGGVAIGSFLGNAHYESIQGGGTSGATATLLINPAGRTVGIGAYATGLGGGGLGTANTLDISGATSIGNDYWSTTAPTNGLIVQGSVGIGTTSPITSLAVSNTNSSVSGSFSGTANNLSVGLGSASTGPFIQGYAGFLSATTNLNLNPSGGNVGIGTTSPSAALSVVGNNGTFGTQAFFTTGTGASGTAIGGNGTIGNIQGQTAANGAVANLTINANGGNVGIGSINAGVKLTVTAGSNAPQALFSNDGTDGIFMRGDSSSGNYNWFISNNYTVNGGLEFAPSTATGGATSDTPVLVLKQGGAATISSSLAIGGASIGSNAFAVTGSSYISGAERADGGVGVGLAANNAFTSYTATANSAYGINLYNQNTSGTAAQASIGFNNNNYNANISLNGSGYTTSSYLRADGLSVLNAGPGGVDIAATNASGEMRFWTGGANQRVTIQSGGNVGIGTTTPGSLLSVGTTNGINFSTATSTFNSTGGINLTSGCFAVQGTCIGLQTPTETVLTSGTNATYAVPAGAQYIQVRLVGGGGGGGGGANGAASGTGATGSTTSFGVFTALGGTGGTGNNNSTGGAGGTGGSGTANLRIPGSAGGAAGNGANSNQGYGGGSAFFGGGGSSESNNINSPGNAGTANTGGGGSGGGYAGGTANGGAGGGGGESAEVIINNPAATYTYTIGTGGGGGVGGQGTNFGGTGGSGVIVVDVYYAIQGNDYAENYPTNDATLSAGEIVSFSTSSPSLEGVVRAQQGSGPIAGIVSTQPGQLLGVRGAVGQVPLALNGEVPVKVNFENGDIHTGDRIALSSTPGLGRKAQPFEASVGIAMEDDTQALPSPTVMVFVNLQPGLSLANIHDNATTTAVALVAPVATSTASTTPNAGFVSTFSTTLQTAIQGLGSMVVRVFSGAISASTGIFNQVFAKEVHTDKLCISDNSGETCVTKSQLDSLLSGAGASQGTSGNGSGTATSTSDGAGGTATSTPNGGSAATSTPPTITLIGADPAQLNVGDTYVDPGVTVSSTVSPNIGYTMSLDGGTSTPPSQFTLNTSEPGNHIILYSATDQNGATGTATRTVIVADPNATSSAATSTQQ